jgi:hypothetical protein
MSFEDRHLGPVDFIRDAFRNDLAREGGVLRQDVLTSIVHPTQ